MTDPQHRPSQIVRRGLVLGLALLLTLLLLAGCALLKPPARDPLAAYRPALRAGFSLKPAQLDALLRYSITVRIDPTARIYTGTMDVTIPVTGTKPLSELYFRLYPNLKQFDGSMQIGNARVNGINVNYSYTTTGSTAAHITLPAPLQTGEKADVQLRFTGKAPHHSDGFYTIFGLSEGVLSLTNFYPILAGRRGDEWALDLANPQGDVGFHDAALYQVEVTAPVGQVIAASGTATTARPDGDGWVTYRYVQGPAREFTLLLSPDLRVEETEAYGTRVRSFYLPGDEAAGHSALYVAVAALGIYNKEFGPYPYRDMSVVEAPLTFHGMEFPGLNLIGSQTYNKSQNDLETRVAHEVAHQWWYNQIGSDQVDSPWQDEGLTEFSMYYYFADRYGPSVGDALRRSRWATPVQIADQRGKDAPVGLPVAAYSDNYETMVYGKGALFFATLRDELGPDTFLRFLHTYIERYQWRIATPDDLKAVAEEVSGRDLTALFNQWLEGTQ